MWLWRQASFAVTLLVLTVRPAVAQGLPSTCEMPTAARQCAGPIEPLGLSQSWSECRDVCERLSAECCQFADQYCKASFDDDAMRVADGGRAAACSPYTVPQRGERLKRWDR